MLSRIKKLIAAVVVVGATVAVGPASRAQTTDDGVDVDTVIVEEGIRDSSDEVRLIVAMLYVVAGSTAALTIAYFVHTNPSRRIRFGRKPPAHKAAKRPLPLGFDELVPGAPPIGARSPAPNSVGTNATNVEATHG